MRAMAIGTTGIGLQMRGDFTQGVAMIQDALAERAWPEGLRAKLMQYLCTLFLQEGDLIGAESSARTGLSIVEKTPTPETRSFCLYHLGVVHYLWDQFARAEHYLQELLFQYNKHQWYLIHQMLFFLH